MKKITLKLFILSLFAVSLSVNAQKANNNLPEAVDGFIRCAADEHNAQLLQDNPNMMGSETYERLLAPKVAEIKRQLESGALRGGSVQFTIPVVVHVIHNGEPIGVGPNISDAQVLSQIQVLNEDYRRLAGSRGFNTDPNGADIEIEFCLAQQDPEGCVTTGIDRVDMSSVSTSWSGPGGNTDSVLKPMTTWDASQYMNMWSVNFSSGSLLGYAQFPGGPANTDGVVSNYTFFGSNDAPGVNIPGSFNLGRTMTHEVGHYLGLFHTFQGGCAGAGDQCADTPAVDQPNFGCPTTHSSCGTLDMVRNYMDYTDDACMNIFTNDQKARVIAVMNTAANRPNTTTSDKCSPLADVTADGSIAVNFLVAGAPCSGEVVPNVRIQNFGTVALTSATISYNIDGGTSSDYSWTGNLATGEFEDIDLPIVSAGGGQHDYNVSIASPNGNADERNCNDTDTETFTGVDSYAQTTEVRLTIVPDDYGSETEWTFSDDNGVLFSGGPYTNNNSTPINETFAVVPSACYTFTITDSYGDGICCGFGNGSYELRTDDDTVIFAGGEFSDTESTDISTFALSVDDYFANGNLYLYPNPTSSNLNIKVGNNNDLPNSYEIVNILGQTITRNTIENNQDLSINTSALSNGAYFIKIIKNDSSVTLPFIKE